MRSPSPFCRSLGQSMHSDSRALHASQVQSGGYPFPRQGRLPPQPRRQGQLGRITGMIQRGSIGSSSLSAHQAPDVEQLGMRGVNPCEESNHSSVCFVPAGGQRGIDGLENGATATRFPVQAVLDVQHLIPWSGWLLGFDADGGIHGADGGDGRGRRRNWPTSSPRSGRS